MKSLERKFKEIKEKEPYMSDLMCFALASSLSVYSERTIRKWFNQLVSDTDYDLKDKRIIVRQLCGRSKRAVESTK